MEIPRCPQCGRKGFITLRYTKYRDLRYPYIGHYNPKKKSKRSWCLIKESQIKSLKVERFWQYKYYKKIEEGADLREKTDDIEIWNKPFEIAKKLLEKHGYPKASIWHKIEKDLKIELTRRIKGHYPSKKLEQDRRSEEEKRRDRYERLKKSLGIS